MPRREAPRHVNRQCAKPYCANRVRGAWPEIYCPECITASGARPISLAPVPDRIVAQDDTRAEQAPR